MADWRANEIEFELEDGSVAEYHYGGDCDRCGTRTYYCVSKERADNELGMRLTAFVSAASNEPPIPYCQQCYLIANPNIAEHIANGIDAMDKEKNKSEFQRTLDQLTASLGGIAGE